MNYYCVFYCYCLQCQWTFGSVLLTKTNLWSHKPFAACRIHNDNILAGSCWNPHSGGKWGEVWLPVPALTTLYLHCTDFPCSCLQLSVCFLLFPSSSLFFYCLTVCSSPFVAMSDIWVSVNPLSQCFGSFMCPKIDFAALWHTDPSSSLNGPVRGSRGLWKEGLIPEPEPGGEWATWKSGPCGKVSRWCFKVQPKQEKKEYHQY